MSELQELIQKLCPDGVEYKKLGDKQVSIMQRGTSLTKNNSTEGAYPVISVEEFQHSIVTNLIEKVKLLQ